MLWCGGHDGMVSLEAMDSVIHIPVVEVVIISSSTQARGRTREALVEGSWEVEDIVGMRHIRRAYTGTRQKTATRATGLNNCHATKNWNSELAVLTRCTLVCFLMKRSSTTLSVNCPLQRKKSTGCSAEYVEQWSHLWHIVSADCDDKHDIVNRRNILRSQINNVLWYFGKCQPLVKQKLLYAYCYSWYGSVLWDLNIKHIEAMCTAWRKDLRRAWNSTWYALCSAVPAV